MESLLFGLSLDDVLCLAYQLVITSCPYKADLSSKAPMEKRLSCKKTGKSMKGKSVAPKKKKLSFGSCLYCNELFEETPDDDCIRCAACLRWALDQCAGVNGEDDYFRCDLC